MRKNRKENITLAIALIALLISLLQFIFTSPFFIDFYNRTGFSVVEKLPFLREKNITLNYQISNSSDKTVKDIEIVIQVLKSDYIQILPFQNSVISEKENGPHFKYVTIKINTLVKNESLFLLIDTNSDSLKYYNSDFIDRATILKNENDSGIKWDTINIRNSKYLLFPSVVYAKHENGESNIERFDRLEILRLIEHE